MEQSINRVELLGRTGNRPTLRHTQRHASHPVQSVHLPAVAQRIW